MSAPHTAGSALTREAILRALSSLAEELGSQGETGELCRFGGTVMVLVQDDITRAIVAAVLCFHDGDD